MERVIHSKKETGKVVKRKVKSKKDVNKIRGRKIRSYDEEKGQNNFFSRIWYEIKKRMTKKNVTYLFLGVIDVILIICVARKNVVNYADFLGKSIFVGDEKNLILGRNNISIVVTLFFYGYICLVNRFFLGQKNTKKFLVSLLFILVVLNGILFYCFTTRVY